MTVATNKKLIKRRIKYLDRSIQGWLIILMVISQILFLVIGSYWFYYDFSTLLDKHLYSIHGLNLGIVSQHVNSVVIKILSSYLIINFLALGIVHYIWVNYIKRVLSEFKLLAEESQSLDFSIKEEKSTHRVNKTFKRWRNKQRLLWISINKQIKKLPLEQNQLRDKKQQIIKELKSIQLSLKQTND